MKEKLCSLTLVIVLIAFLGAELVLLPSESTAKTEVVYASYKYVMGDNDTKNDAKRLCFLEAKRRCLEKVGTYVESITEVKNYKLTKDEIRSYTAAIVKVEVVSEEIAFEGQSVVINTTVKAEIDADHTKRELQKIKKDKALQARIREQQNKIESMENKIRRLQTELDSSSYEKSPQLIDKRRQTLGNLDIENERLRKITLTKRTRDAKRPGIIAQRTKNRRLVLQYAEMGMTSNEIRKIIKEISSSDDLRYVKDKYPKRFSGVYEWDKMYFNLKHDEYTNVWVLSSIFSKFGSRTVILKDKNFNILLDFDQFIRTIEEKLEELKSNPYYRKWVREHGKSAADAMVHVGALKDYSKNEVTLYYLYYHDRKALRSYLWGE